jgi:competence/damage-inducible protein CinA-like protein
MQAEILTIGTELLLGEIVDTNTAAVARALRDVGANLYLTTTVGDNPERIAQAVRQALQRSDVLITTGGLGPTVDDPTREAVAAALGVPLEFRPELWEQIRQRFAAFGRLPGENNRRQAHVPAGSQAIPNPVGTAPGFIAEQADRLVISLPGVPAEMVYLLDRSVAPFLRARYQLAGGLVVRRVRTAGAAESWIDEQISDLEQLSNPTVGVSAHPGRVDIRVTARGATTPEADALLEPLIADLLRRLGECVYAVGEETLEQVVAGLLDRHSWTLAVVESGVAGVLTPGLAGVGRAFAGAVAVPALASDSLSDSLEAAVRQFSANVGLGLQQEPLVGRRAFTYLWTTPDASAEDRPAYGGPPEYASAWVASRALDSLRRSLAGRRLS